MRERERERERSGRVTVARAKDETIERSFHNFRIDSPSNAFLGFSRGKRRVEFSPLFFRRVARKAGARQHGILTSRGFIDSRFRGLRCGAVASETPKDAGSDLSTREQSVLNPDRTVIDD